VVNDDGGWAGVAVFARALIAADRVAAVGGAARMRAVARDAGLGSNATVVIAASNAVTVGLAPIWFRRFIRHGLPLTAVAVAWAAGFLRWRSFVLGGAP
jgi:hypothetical protein